MMHHFIVEDYKSDIALKKTVINLAHVQFFVNLSFFVNKSLLLDHLENYPFVPSLILHHQD